MAFAILPTHSFSLNQNRSLRPDTFEENRSGFEVATFSAGEISFGGHEFASEGFCEDCLRQFLGSGSRRLDALLNVVG